MPTTPPVPIEFDLPEGWRTAPPDEATLSEIADESVERLRQVSTSVEVRNRRDFASPDAPGFAQRLAVTTVVNGVSRDLGQAQVSCAPCARVPPGPRSGRPARAARLAAPIRLLKG